MVLGQFSPGPDMLLLTRSALREGAATGVKMALGISCGLTVHATLAIGGMAVALERFPMLRRVLQWVAALYLLWIALGLIRLFLARRSGKLVETRPGQRVHPPFLTGLLCNLLNPKVALFLAAVCAPFLAGSHPQWWPFALWSVVVGLGASLWSLWVLALQWRPLRSGYQRAAQWLDGLFALALIALALQLMTGW